MSLETDQHTELFTPGHLACPGCGAALAMKLILPVLGPKTIVVMPAGCWSTFIGIYPNTCLNVPVMSVAFETTAAVASGIRAALDIQGDEETTVLGWAGDGGTLDIGLQALSGAAERNENILYICYDNEAYMNTGIQRSSSTPARGWSTTTPSTGLKTQPKKDILDILAAHRIPYAATASISHPDDLKVKVTRAKKIQGTRFIHLLASCPTGWRHGPELSVEVARLAVKTRVFPLYEVMAGTVWNLNSMPEKAKIEDYLRIQGRFKFMSQKDCDGFQEEVDQNWALLQRKCQLFTSPCIDKSHIKGGDQK